MIVKVCVQPLQRNMFCKNTVNQPSGHQISSLISCSLVWHHASQIQCHNGLDQWGGRNESVLSWFLLLLLLHLRLILFPTAISFFFRSASTRLSSSDIQVPAHLPLVPLLAALYRLHQMCMLLLTSFNSPPASFNKGQAQTVSSPYVQITITHLAKCVALTLSCMR